MAKITIYNHKIAKRIQTNQTRLLTFIGADWERKRIEESIAHDKETLARHGYAENGKAIVMDTKLRARFAELNSLCRAGNRDMTEEESVEFSKLDTFYRTTREYCKEQ